MASLIDTIKAVLTRLIFGTHGFVAIWRVTSVKGDPYFWYLSVTLLALFFEGLFTMAIKKTQEWKWFCPSVFIYLCSVVPPIWILELDKYDRRLRLRSGINITLSGEELEAIKTFGVELKIPVQLDADTWATVIEQLLMLILIIGRWMLPKGDLTRDQLSQLLLVYIGTAADIIEFFDAFKDEKIADNRTLCTLILCIWSWSLLQFTFVLTATKSRKSRMGGDVNDKDTNSSVKAASMRRVARAKEICCSIDVWAILINIVLQDAPFLIFRLLLILHYDIISYMNIFFTSKNTLVIALQFYRLIVVQQENKQLQRKDAKRRRRKMRNTDNERVPTRTDTSSDERLYKVVQQVTQQHKSKKNLKKISSNDAVNRSSSIESIVVAMNSPTTSVGPGNLTSTTPKDQTNDTVLKLDNNIRRLRRKSMSTGNLYFPNFDSKSKQLTAAAGRPLGGIGKGTANWNRSILKHIQSQKRSSENSQSETDTTLHEEDETGSEVGVIERKSISIGSKQSSAESKKHLMKDDVTDHKTSQEFIRSVVSGDIKQLKREMKLEEERQRQIEQRVWQRRSAIGVVFFLFLLIMSLCLVFIYGGINPKGLVLRETLMPPKRVKVGSGKVTTTTTTPETRSSNKVRHKHHMIQTGKGITLTKTELNEGFKSHFIVPVKVKIPDQYSTSSSTQQISELTTTKRSTSTDQTSKIVSAVFRKKTPASQTTAVSLLDKLVYTTTGFEELKEK